MLKEKQNKSKNGSESKSKSGGVASSQSSGSSEASGSVKEGKPDTDGPASNKKDEGRKSATPVKSEPGSGGAIEKKESSGESATIKSEVKLEEGTPPNPSDLPTSIKQEDGCGEMGDRTDFGQSAPQQQQQQQQPINKQSNNAEYMQQQSQIFVFSTKLANAGAEAVLSGQFQSIIAYHCAQPGTKKFLEKHPLKLAQFNRQNPNQWMANMSQGGGAKNKQQMMRGGPMGNAGPPMGAGMHPNNFKPQGMPPQQQQQLHPNNNISSNFLSNPSMEDIINGTSDDIAAAWEQTAGNLSLDSLAQNGDAANLLDDPTTFLDNDHGLSDTGGGGNSLLSPGFPGHPHQTLQGVKIPDENLTPQQRQHREEQLATLRRIQKMFSSDYGNQMDCQMMGQEMKMGPGGMQMNPMAQMQMNPMAQMRGAQGMMPGYRGPPPMGNQMGEMMGEMGGGMNQIAMDNPGMTGQMSGGMMMANKMGHVPAHMMEVPWNQMRQGGPGFGGPGGPKKLPPQQGGQQGPPPPYHQTTRSASVPIATQSPTPGSPNNPGSQNPMSLPSPRAYNSTLNSPAADRLAKGLAPGQSPSHDSPAMHRGPVMSNPSTPMSAHLSPSTSLKGEGADAASNNEGKEPNLMPVPSPQQIQYLNTFEGQELTIQKQPNTGVNKESPPGSAEKKNPNGSGATPSYPNTPSNPGSNQNTSSNNLSATNFPVPSSPSTGVPPNSAPCSDSKICSKGINSSPQQLRQQTPTVSEQQSLQQQADLFPASSPQGFPPGGLQMQQGKGFPDNCPPPGQQFPPCSRPENVPLNPNSSIPPPSKISHFDPISSLAQMSQQLTNSVSGGPMGGGGGNLNPQQGGGGGSMMTNAGGFMPPDMVDCMSGGLDCPPQMGGPGMGNPQLGNFGGLNMGAPMGGPRSMSPKLGMPPNFGGPGMPQRIIGRPMGPQSHMYNGANVQVKPGASNTIQYLPPRGPQMGGNNPQNPRGPPNLEFLQRYAGPMNNPGGMGGDGISPRMQNMQYFPGPGGPNFNSMDGDVLPSEMNAMGPQPGMMLGNQMMRPRAPLRMPMGGGPQFNPGGGGGPPPNSNPFGPKMLPDGQPLPPSGGMPPGMTPGNFVGPGPNKFGGPNNANSDPNYAQQFHNFQQQLYATNPRGQLSQQSYFAPK